MSKEMSHCMDEAFEIIDARQLRAENEKQAARIEELEAALERMRVAGGSAEFHRMFELAKDLL